MAERGRTKKIDDPEILSILEDTRLTTSEIAERLNISPKTVNRRLTKLELEGLIIKTEAGQTNLWEIKNPKEPGDGWIEHYRGMRIHFNNDGNLWWQVYKGYGKLKVTNFPENLKRTLLQHKPEGGRICITEDRDVLTKITDEDDEESYKVIWLGKIKNSLELAPLDKYGEILDEHSISINSSNLESGDLWPSIFDGAKYSFVGRDRIWWQSPEGLRYPVIQRFPKEIMKELLYHKPEGGSFRITPYRDIITLIPAHPKPEKAGEQFRELPDVVKKIIKLRKDNGVEMLPIYIGKLHGAIDLGKPQTITEPLSEGEIEEIIGWIRSFGSSKGNSSIEVEDDPEDW